MTGNAPRRINPFDILGGDWPEPFESEELDSLLSSAPPVETKIPVASIDFLIKKEEWMCKGICRLEKISPSVFVTDQGKNSLEAVQYCRRCPVSRQCFDYGIETKSIGVFGGIHLNSSNWSTAEFPDLKPEPEREYHLEWIENPPEIKKHQLPPVVLFTPTQDQGTQCNLRPFQLLPASPSSDAQGDT